MGLEVVLTEGLDLWVVGIVLVSYSFPELGAQPFVTLPNIFKTNQIRLLV